MGGHTHNPQVCATASSGHSLGQLGNPPASHSSGVQVPGQGGAEQSTVTRQLSCGPQSPSDVQVVALLL
jgi:hypothetical protein